MEKLLSQVYFSPDSSACYSSPANVLREARKKNSNVTLENVMNFLEKQVTYTRFRRITRNFKRLKTIPSGLNSDWQADLAVFQSIAKFNNDNNYLLLCVDVLSRKMYVEPIKHKTSTYMIPAFENIFKKAGTCPWSLYTDSGLEFCSKAMREFYDKNQIEKYEAATHPILHATIAERAIRTIKERLYRYFNEKNTHKWIDVIQKLVNSINNTINTTTKVKPAEVTYNNANDLYDKVFKESDNLKKPNFKVGDIVRIDQAKKTFKKGVARFSAELFKITEVLAHRTPIVYKICDLADESIKGYFYEQELSKSDIKSNYTVEKVLKTRKVKGKTELFVKWKGFPSTYSRWIRKEELR